MSQVFTCNIEGFKSTSPIVEEALVNYKRACLECASETEEVGKESGIDALQKAAHAITDIVENTVVRNIKATETVFEELKGNIKTTEELATAGGAI